MVRIMPTVSRSTPSMESRTAKTARCERAQTPRTIVGHAGYDAALMDRRLIGIIGFAAGLAIVIGIVLIARGGGDEEDSGSSEVSTDLTEKPVPATGGDPPTELVSEDIVEGDGAEAKAGDKITVQYVGVDFATGEEFDSSWDGEPFEFELGSGEVIPGWDQGVVGMKEGGRRQLTIPPDLAYGPEGAPPAIGPDATLAFVIDLESVK